VTASAHETSNEFFRVRDLSVHYGAIQGVCDLDFSVKRGEVLCLIGSNGAGKSTTLRAISGLVKPSKGSIIYRGESITGLEPHEIVRRKLCQVPEGRGIFLNLTVEENLDLGAWIMKDRSSFNDDLAHVFGLFPRLKERRKQYAGTLSGGELQMLAIGRALMAHPDFLLLDEPSLGLAPQVIEKIFEIILQINKDGKTILLVEQNALQALQVAHHGLVLESGRIVLQGPAKELLVSDEVRRSYLGI
jgi:branched-chain amino acid transport system ATP-binding protein